MLADRFGWRSELSAGILTNLDEIDIVKVIADDCFGNETRTRALKTPPLRRQRQAALLPKRIPGL